MSPADALSDLGDRAQAKVDAELASAKSKGAGYSFRQYCIPERMMGGLQRYIEQGVLPGDFLRAVLRNDFREAVVKADEENLQNLPAYAAFLYNEAPCSCYGSPEKVAAWVEYKQARAIP